MLDDEESALLDEQEQALREANQEAGIRALLSTPIGRQYLFDFLYGCRVFSTVFNEAHATMAFYEGRRCVGLQLLADITKYAPDLNELMMRENNHRGMQ